jgi:hypothetical protein
MEDSEAIKSIKDLFKTPSLLGLWPLCKAKYEELGFTDELSDRDKIDEYTYIYEQYKKFVFSHQVPVLKHSRSLYSMNEYVEELIAKTAEKADTRKKLVYFALRDDWLTVLWQTIQWFITREEQGV